MNQNGQKGGDDKSVDAIERKAARKIAARASGPESMLFGFGMFGLIGWAIAAPTLAGVALGLWLDKAAPSDFSWTLALLAAGVCIGCWNAWTWVVRERPGGDDAPDKDERENGR